MFKPKAAVADGFSRRSSAANKIFQVKVMM